jgi:hypothetical protein
MKRKVKGQREGENGESSEIINCLHLVTTSATLEVVTARLIHWPAVRRSELGIIPLFDVQTFHPSLAAVYLAGVTSFIFTYLRYHKIKSAMVKLLKYPI